MANLGPSTGAFLRLGSPYSELDPARFVVVGIPYEGSPAGREGVARGPASIFEASRTIEFFDEENFRSAARFGIATIEPEFKEMNPDAMAEELHTLAGSLLRMGKRGIYIGGDGSISYGLIRSYLNQYRDLTVLQFDAHPNLRSEHRGVRFGRMSVMNKLRNDLPIVQCGIRSLSEEEAEFCDKGKVTTLFAADMARRPLKSELIPDILSGLSDHVYVNLDMTVFDPSLCPGVNLPQPGGLDWMTVLEILKAVARDRDIVAMDLVETVPLSDHNVTQVVAGRMAYKVMGFLGQFRKWPPMEVS